MASHVAILLVVVLLNTFNETSTAPLPICSSKCECEESTTTCSTMSSTNEVEASQIVDRITLSDCNGFTNDTMQEIKTFALSCGNLKKTLDWKLSVGKIELSYNNNITQDEYNKKLERRSCRDVCVEIQKIVQNTTCICVTYTSLFPDDMLIASSNISDSIFGNKTNNMTSNKTDDDNNKTATTNSKWRFHFVVFIGAVSLTTLLVNLLLLVTFCVRHNATVIGCFGLSLMVFNILMACYGAAMAIYLSQYETHWKQQFCQGFTSVKLFAMGASVWTMILLTYHNSINTSTIGKRDAIFKSIVYILEGLMLSGVFAVMSWIKLDKWDYLCVIYEPHTTVDWMLTGIELWYYFMALALIVRYPIHELRKKKKVIEEKMKDTNFPVFLIVLVCFVFWVGGYAITSPWYKKLFEWKELNGVIRVSSVVFPLIIQPIIYAVRNTCCCICRKSPCSKNKNNAQLDISRSIILHCDCSDDETCPACLADSDVRLENTMFLDRHETEANGKSSSHAKLRLANETDDTKSTDSKKGQFFPSKAVPRSPLLRKGALNNGNTEEMPLLQNEKEKEKKETKKIVPKTLALPDDSIPLLDDTDGSLRKPPKATLDKDSAMNSPADYPSFITMENAIDVDALPKLKSSPKLKPKPSMGNEEGRKSRGPTFYPLEEEIPNPVEKPNKKKRKQKNGGIQQPPKSEDSNDDTKNPKPEASKPSKRKRKPKKKSSVVECSGNKTPTHNSQRNSTVSLEWDHSYSYSDSSGSSSGRGSASFPEDEAVVPGPVVNSTSPMVENGGIQYNSVKNDKEHGMEWDPSACQMKLSPGIKANTNVSTDTKTNGNNQHTSSQGVELKNKNNINKNKKISNIINLNANGKTIPLVNTTQPS